MKVVGLISFAFIVTTGEQSIRAISYFRKIVIMISGYVEVGH